jgi:hypoxanthine phosphoribosyltransferase
VRRARGEAECLFSHEQVLFAIDQLAVRVTVDLADTNPLLLCVMNGAVPFAGALLPRLHFPLELDYVHVSRYHGATEGGNLHWHAHPQCDLAGRTVLLVDDVLDHGVTLAALREWAADAGASAVYSAVLADKQIAASRPTEADYAALACPDRFLIGWGMDFQGYWRNLDGIYALSNQ